MRLYRIVTIFVFELFALVDYNSYYEAQKFLSQNRIGIARLGTFALFGSVFAGA
jgi:hypothetical protein